MPDDYETSSDTCDTSCDVDTSTDTSDTSSDVDTSSDCSDTSTELSNDGDLCDDGSDELPEDDNDSTDDSDISEDTSEETTDDTEISDDTSELSENGDLSDDGSDELPDGDNDTTTDTTTDTSEDTGEEIPNDTKVADKTSEFSDNGDLNDSSNQNRLNDNPYEDVSRAFDYVDSQYPKDSPTWQECANRQVELNQSKIDSLKPEYDSLVRQRNDLDQKLQDYIRTNEMTPEKCAVDLQYQDLLSQRQEVNNKCNEFGGKITQCQNKIDAVSEYLNPEMKTTFKGFNGSDFSSAYDGMNTRAQGNAIPGYRGVCGVNECANVTNQQTGSKIDEATAIKEFTQHNPPLCETTSLNPNHNGGTRPDQREAYLKEKGLTFEAQGGTYKGQGTPLTLEQMSDRFNNGESIGLRLRGQDLSQPELAKRSAVWNRPETWKNGDDFTNHMTTVAGFSYDSNNKPTGVWLNDTSGGRPNRLFVSSDKFYQMQDNTRGFQAEYSKYKGV